MIDNRKFRYIYYPFLLSAIGMLGGYTFLRWYLDIHLGILPLKDIILDFVFPGILSLLIVFLFLRKRFKVLDVTEKTGDFIRFVGILTIFVPTLILQLYIVERLQKLYDIHSVYDIEKVRTTDCFRIEDMNVLKPYAVTNATSHVSGKHNDKLNFDAYVIAPLTDHTNRFDGERHRFWYGFREHTSRRNSGSDELKNKEYRRFQQETWSKFDNHNPYISKYLSVVGYSDHRDAYIEAIQRHAKNIDPDNIVILVAQTKEFDNTASGKLLWVFIIFGIGNIVFLVMLVRSSIHEKRYKIIVYKQQELEDDSLRDLIWFLTFRTPMRTTPGLVNLNVLIFLLMMCMGVHFMHPGGAALLEWGALRGEEFFSGEYWRILTAMFIHAGFAHLAYNCIGLGLIGYLLEASIGSAKLLLIYLLSGIGGGCVSLWWHPEVVTVGASGAIFGLIGLAIVLYLKRLDKDMNSIYGFIILGYGGIGLLVGLLTPGIDNAGHIGGLITGILVSFLLLSVSGRREEV